MSRVGENIKKVREASGLSAKALAKKMGVSESFLVELEGGRRVINEAMLQRFSKVVGKNKYPPMIKMQCWSKAVMVNLQVTMDRQE